ncbi:hypothetical protein LJR039_005424 [Pseudorhodoferax sp. LjRoot39]|uniref:hypothetical protein n=1 Tax=Pseudorhodoferax sp. LjRoot39 TaxID=3342328 RepID=UPI003ECF828D
MLYDRHNALGAQVFEIGRREPLKRVMSVDTDVGIVVAAHDPLRLHPNREQVETYQIRFRAIHAIHGGSDKPVLFHCYDRLQESPAGMADRIHCRGAAGHWAWR